MTSMPHSATRSGPGPRRSGRRGIRIGAIVVGILLLVVLVARFAVSPIASSIANRKLAELEGFNGRVGGIEIALWSGSVVVNEFVLQDEAHPDDPPLVRIPKLTLTGAVRPMMQGKLGGRAVIENAQFNIVKRRTFDGPVDALEEAKDEVQERQAEARRWQDALREVIPMEMSHVEIKNAEMRFIDEAHEPKVDVGMKKVNVVMTGLRNRPDPSGAPMEVRMTGTTTGEGQLELYVRADPMAEPLEFFSTFELKDLSLPPFNNFMRAYTGTDVSSGKFDVYMEATVKGGGYEGYLKPFFQDLNFATVNDEDKPLWDRVKEGAVSVVSNILENDSTQKVATQTPFSGRFGENQLGLWETLENLWSNAFVRALREGLQGQTPAES